MQASNEDLLQIIKKYPEAAYNLCSDKNINKKTLDACMSIIVQHPRFCYKYADEIVHGRWKKGEPTLAKDTDFAISYAKNILKNRFKLAEDLLLQDANSAADYACQVVKKRWKKGEDIIAKDANCSYKYAKMLNSRFNKGEDAISENPQTSFYYALYVIRGKLPTKMHQRMIGHALSDPDNEYVNKYFQFIKRQENVE